MSNEQLFANGRIAVLSNKLLTADKYIRLTECGNLAEALRTLGECGYSAAAAESDYEQALRVACRDQGIVRQCQRVEIFAVQIRLSQCQGFGQGQVYATGLYGVLF